MSLSTEKKCSHPSSSSSISSLSPPKSKQIITSPCISKMNSDSQHQDFCAFSSEYVGNNSSTETVLRSLPEEPGSFNQSDRELLNRIAATVSILPRIETDIEEIKANNTSTDARLTKLETENDTLKLQVAVLAGKNEKIESDLSTLRDMVLGLSFRQMRENVLIHNLPETKGEDCVSVVSKFFINEMKIQSNKIASKSNPAGQIKIDVAHRVGPLKDGYIRAMVVKFVDRNSKLSVQSYAKNLKGKDYSVSDQLPKETRERRQAQVPTLKKLKQENSKSKVALIGDKLVKDSKLVEPDFEKDPVSSSNINHVYQPTDFTINSDITDRGSVYRAYAIKIDNKHEASNAVTSLFQFSDFAQATHRVYCYNTRSDHGWSDDKEFSAGQRLYKALSDLNREHVFVCVTRVYGGTNLGEARFQHYITAATEAIKELPDS